MFCMRIAFGYYISIAFFIGFQSRRLSSLDDCSNMSFCSSSCWEIKTIYSPSLDVFGFGTAGAAFGSLIITFDD